MAIDIDTNLFSMDASNGFASTGLGQPYGDANGKASPIFSIEKVQLQFTVNNVVSLVVANNILCMALKTGRIIRIDLEHPQDIDGELQLPYKVPDLTKQTLTCQKSLQRLARSSELS